MKKPPLYKSFAHAFRGLFLMIKTERNFQLELLALLVNLILIWVLKLSATDAVLILMLCGMVLVAEILNTCIEKICDFICPNFDPRIGKIKDMAAGAVILAAIFSVVAGILIYSRYIFLI